MRISNPFFYFLIGLSLAGGGLALLATSLYGAGVSADAVKNMSTAESLLAGRGFFEHSGGALVYWPPLYPLLLAGLSALTGWDVFVSGWYFNALTMMVNVFLAGMLIYDAFREKPIYAYLGGLFVLASVSALRIHANVSSDPLYITFSLLFLLAANRYMQKKSMSALWVMIACAALATLQRWLGASLMAMGGLVILAARWKQWRQFLRDGSLMGLSLAPVGGWIYFHNILQYQTFWGNDSPPLDPWMNFEFSLTKMMHWFLPYHPRLSVLLYNPLIVLGVVLLFLIIIARRQDWAAWWRTLWKPNAFPAVFFFPLSLVGIALVIVTRDHLDPYSDRYYIGFLASVIIILFTTLDTLVLPRLRVDLGRDVFEKSTIWFQRVILSRVAAKNLELPGELQVPDGDSSLPLVAQNDNQDSFETFSKNRVIVAVMFGIWLLAYPTFSMYKYISASMADGEASNYNYYNNRFFNENPAIPVIQELVAENPEAYFYSNYADGIWFYTSRSAPLMPRSSVEMDMVEIREKFNGWPGDKPGYIMWFLPNEFKHVVPPELLAEIADVELIFESERGVVYSVEAK